MTYPEMIEKWAAQGVTFFIHQGCWANVPQEHVLDLAEDFWGDEHHMVVSRAREWVCENWRPGKWEVGLPFDALADLRNHLAERGKLNHPIYAPSYA